MALSMNETLKDSEILEVLCRNLESFRFKNAPYIIMTLIPFYIHPYITMRLEDIESHDIRNGVPAEVPVFGRLGNIVEILASTTNFTYRVIALPDRSCGARTGDGTWPGMVGQVFKDDADIGVSSFAAMKSRFEDTDMTYNDTLNICSARGSAANNPWEFLLPFTPVVWAYFVASLILVCTAHFVIEALCNKRDGSLPGMYSSTLFKHIQPPFNHDVAIADGIPVNRMTWKQSTCSIIFAVLLFCELIDPTQSVEVIRFQEDGVATADSEAIYMGPLSRSTLVDSLTICGRFKIFFLHTRATLFFLADHVDDNVWKLRAEIWVDKVRVAISYTWNFQPLPQQLWAFRWYHLCFTYDHTQGRIQTFLNGKMVRQMFYDVGRPVKGDFAKIGSAVRKDESYSGDIAQVNVWDRVLPDNEIEKIANCQIDPQGNYISWEAGWEKQNVTSYEMSMSQFCQEDNAKLYFWFPGAGEAEALYICEALGTHLPTVTSLQESQHLHDVLNAKWPDSEKCPNYYWSDLNDKKEENVWVRGYDNMVDNITHWAPNEPNGYRYENCAAIHLKGVIDDDCAWIRCALCIFTEPQRFIIRGTCETELRNVYFVAYQEAFGSLIFKSYGSYHIKNENNTWYYIDTVNDEVIAWMEEFELNYPMGRRWWWLERNLCDQKGGERKRLLLSPCNNDQYTCDDGTCIPLPFRCDLKYDCRDQSDELECEIISFPEDYHNHLPPRVPRQADSNVAIVIKVRIKSIDVQTVEMNMRLSYELVMSWFDNRLEFLNLKVNESLNAPRVKTMMELWSPIVKLLNTDTIDDKLLSEDASASIKRLSAPIYRDDSEAGEVDVFSGEENLITVSRKYTTTYTCQFDLTLYPFDDQHCDMHLQVVSGLVSFLEVHPNSSVVYLGSKTLNEYQIGEERMLLGDDRLPSEVRVRIPLIRLYGHSILNIYIPSLILLIISYLTLFFRKSFFDVRIMAALTALLVLATLFAQASASLPKTSYFKMVDIWLLFCVMMTFLVIIFHILIDNRLSQDTQVKSIAVYPEGKALVNKYFKGPSAPFSVQRLEVTAKITVIALFTIFIVAYVGIILF